MVEQAEQHGLGAVTRSADADPDAPTLALPYVSPARPVSRWLRALTMAILVGPPALGMVLAFGSLSDPDVSLWLGLACGAAWVAMLATSVPALARVELVTLTSCAAMGAGTTTLGVLSSDALSGVEADARLVALAVGALAATAMLLTRIRRGSPPQAEERALARRTPGAIAFTETSVDGVRVVIAVLCAVFMLVNGVLLITEAVATGWWMLPAAAVSITTSIPFVVRVSADRRGLIVRSLLLPLPLLRVPLAEIADARAVLVLAREWGGVGGTVQRGSVAVLRRDGAALLVTRTDGTEVVVTLTDPAGAMAVLDELRGRASVDIGTGPRTDDGAGSGAE